MLDNGEKDKRQTHVVLLNPGTILTLFVALVLRLVHNSAHNIHLVS